MNAYEAKKQERIDRYNNRAEAAEEESNSHWNRSHDMLKNIPMGQPILVGHHSEKGHRALLARADNAMRKTVEASEKAKYYKQKAVAAERNTAISSDDPDAVIKLKEKIEAAEKNQAIYKAINKIVRKKPKNEISEAKKADLLAIGVTEATAIKIFSPDFRGIGIPSYKLTNNNANINRMKKRLEQLERLSKAEYKETEYIGFTIIENPDENRIQIEFHSKQIYLDLCKNKGINLKEHGFKYSGSTGLWQRHLNNAGQHAVASVIKLITN